MSDKRDSDSAPNGRDQVEELLASISDGGAVDWESASRDVTNETRGKIEALKAADIAVAQTPAAIADTLIARMKLQS